VVVVVVIVTMPTLLVGWSWSLVEAVLSMHGVVVVEEEMGK